MLLLQDDGSNECIFSADKILQDNNVTVPLVLSLVNDSTRDVTNVTLLKQYIPIGGSTNVPAIFYEDGRVRGYFRAKYPHSGNSNGAHSHVFLLQRGYYSYKLYELGKGGTSDVLTVVPSETDLESNVYFFSGSGSVFNEVDNGKALVVSPTQYTEIKTGTVQNNIRTYDYLNGEVSYTKHTDKITGSQIDTDDNFIHVQ